MIDVVEATIADLREALVAGRTTAVELVDAYRARIDAYDGPGTARALNAVVVLNPRAREEAAESDARRARGETRGPLDGIPYTAKDSYLVRGLTAAAGSPAFLDLVAQRDAFLIERLRAAGAICIGLTNMPPMANGGMQRGAYGRAESPYNPAYLTAPFGSGSSNGSGTATAASFAAFGLGSETWSSGRGPASYNALCAYTPSRGLLSCRGLWPLVPTQDVPVPHSRTMADLLEVLDVIVADDPDPRGDFWRMQPWVAVPATSASRPGSYRGLAVAGVGDARGVLAGKRLGIPRMYVNADPEAGTAENPGIGGPTGRMVETRPGIVDLWERARAGLEAAGATVVEVDFPAVSNYEGDRPGAPTIATRGLVSPEYLRQEIVDLCAWAWDDFLRANGDPRLDSLADVDGSRIFPHPAGALPDRYTGFDDDIAEYPEWVRQHPGVGLEDLTELPGGLRGLDETRRIDLDDWMAGLALDAVVMPTVADVAPADMDVDPDSADLGWRNGVWVANGNLAIRHLGIPTVTVPMGILPDIGMPVGLTFAGRQHDDVSLLRLGAAFEAVHPARVPPPTTPALP
ncbi:MAG TPA: amidase [Naasia sp.]